MRLATIDAVENNVLKATVSIEGRAIGARGRYVLLNNGEEHILGRINNVDRTNVVHQNDAFGPYIMQHGSVPHWSSEVDIERATIELVRVKRGEASIPLLRNPPSGTPVIDVPDNAALLPFLNEARFSACLGTIPNSNGLHCTVINHDFGPVDAISLDGTRSKRGGDGEGRHILVVGRNGSGKSVLATSIVAVRMAQFPEMGLLMPDLAGDLANPDSHTRGDFQWNWIKVADSTGGRQIERIKCTDLRFNSRETLSRSLVDFIRKRFHTSPDKAVEIASDIAELIPLVHNRITWGNLTPDNFFTAAETALNRNYSGKTVTDKINRLDGYRANPTERAVFEHEFNTEIRELFNGSVDYQSLVHEVLSAGRRAVIEDIADDRREFVVGELVQQLRWQAERAFKERGQRACNALIVLDEGQTWIPQERTEEGGLSRRLRAQMRETRKYGIGWMVISQSAAGIHKDFLREAHTVYFGRGMGVGADEEHMNSRLGADGLVAYKQLDQEGGFFWVARGMDNNLGSEGTYFTLCPFSGDATTAIIEANPHIFGDLLNAPVASITTAVAAAAAAAAE
jgi:hypothetical protein